MAGDWIKMRIDLQSHPKIVRILSATDADKFRVIGGLHAVWSVFDTHSVDGVLPGYTPKALDHVIGWPGFSAAMIDVGWLSFRDAEGLAMPEFGEHNGQSAKRRAEDQKRKRDGRNRPQSVRKVSGESADTNGTREREEKEKIEAIPPSSPLPAEKPKPAARKTKIPEPFLVTGEMRKWAAERVPAVNLQLQTEKFVNYWRSEAKTKADWPATWRNWMLTEQANAERRPSGGYPGAVINRQQQVEDINNAVVAEIREREQQRQASIARGELFDMGPIIEIGGERIE